ncbi:hypothetical protein M0802_003583 [Mischocyttarus mexicanus]|nr:hypothetical protein M0802_003583 [Mischocyttarus mexicanus]
MHVRHIIKLFITSFFFFVTSTAIPIGPLIKGNSYHRIDLPRKCCIDGYLFDEELSCVNVIEDNHFLEEMGTEILAYELSCKKLDVTWTEHGPNNSWAYTTVDFQNDYCLETTMNGTQVLARCLELSKMNENSTLEASIISMTTMSKAYNKTTRICNDKNRTKRWESNFWGTSSYMPSNTAHMVFCILVVVIYMAIPELRKGIYNQAVLQHNISLLGLGLVLSILNYGKYPMADDLIIILWLCMQFFTVATVFLVERDLLRHDPLHHEISLEGRTRC